MSEQSMSVGSFLNFGIENAKRHFLKFIGLIIIALIVIGIGSGITAGLAGLLGDAGGALGSILVTFLMLSVTFGFLKNVLNLCRGEKVDFMVFIKTKPTTMLFFIIASLLISVIISIGYVLLIIPGIILTCMLILVPFLVIDRDMSPIDAIKESIKLTSGHKMDIFIGILVGMVVANIISIFVITLVFTIPMALFIYAYPYLQLTGQLEEAKKRLEENA